MGQLAVVTLLLAVLVESAPGATTRLWLAHRGHDSSRIIDSEKVTLHPVEAEPSPAGREGAWSLVKIILRPNESVQEAVRRLRKIVERSGLKRELRRRERYEKPSDVKRKAKLRAIRRSKARSVSK